MRRSTGPNGGPISGKCLLDPGVPRLPMMVDRSATHSSSSTRRFHSRASRRQGPAPWPPQARHVPGPPSARPGPRSPRPRRHRPAGSARPCRPGREPPAPPGAVPPACPPTAPRRSHPGRAREAGGSASLCPRRRRRPAVPAAGAASRSPPPDRTACPVRRRRLLRRRNSPAAGAIRRAPFLQSASPAGAGRCARRGPGATLGPSEAQRRGAAEVTRGTGGRLG